MAGSELMTVASVLREHDTDLSESDLARALRDGFALGLIPSPAAGASLSAPARAFLKEHGAIPTPSAELTRAVRARAVRDLALEVAAAWSTKRVAELLGVDASRVRHRAGDKGLYALSGKAGALRFPHWQFTKDGVLPHLKQVLRTLPEGLHPLEVQGFFMTPADTLEVDAAPVSPWQWLASGGDSAPVVELAAALSAS